MEPIVEPATAAKRVPCALCRQPLAQTKSEEELVAQFRRDYPREARAGDDGVPICEDCWELMQRDLYPEGVG